MKLTLKAGTKGNIMEQILYLGEKEIGRCESVIIENTSFSNLLYFKDSNNNNVKFRMEDDLKLLTKSFSFEGMRKDKDVKCRTQTVGRCLEIYVSTNTFVELYNYFNKEI